MALGSGNIEIDVSTRVDTSRIAREVAAAERRLQPLNLRLDDKGFRQPLGRISGDLAEFEKSLDASVARTLAFGAAVGVINSVSQAFVGMVNNAKEVEKALMDVNVILNLSSKSLAQFSDDLFKVAKDTGQSFEAVSEAAVELSRQGLGASETLKRINDAMILTRLSGMDAAKSVETLTAAVNSFGSTALNTTELVNKLASVDAAFAVSTEDLANALARAGSTAQGAKVSLDELLAAVTSVQQITARGGSVIGNAFKSIFTRIQRSSVREALEEIGVATQDATGQIRNAIDIIKDYAQVYKTLSDGQRAYTDELIAGVFQINNFKALVKDLSGDYSIYDRALKQSNSATDQAIRRNEQLQTTLSALVNEATVNVKSLSAALGELVATPAVENLLKIFNSIAGAVTKSLDGEGFIKKFVDGIGKFLAGPGLIVITVAFVKLFKFITGQAASAIGEIFSLGAAKNEVAETEAKIGFLLKNNYALYEAISNEAMTHDQKEKLVLDTLNAQNRAYQRQEGIIRSLSSSRAVQAAVAPSASASQGFVPRASRGFIPNFANGVEGAMTSEKRAISQGVGGALRSAKPKVIKNFPMGKGKKQTIVANTDEVIVPNYKGGDGSAIFNKKMIKQAGGKPKGAIPVSRGFVPSFAKGKTTTEPEWAQEDPFRNTANSKYGQENTPFVDLEAVLGGIGMIAAKGKKGVTSKVNPQSPSSKSFLGSTGVKNIINDIAGSNLDQSEKEYLYKRLERIGKVKFSNIGVSSISELDQGATNKIAGVSGAIDDVIGPYIANATAAASRMIYSSVLGNEVDANALQKNVLSGFQKGDLKKIVTVDTEGSIFEAAIRLGSKESSKNFGGDPSAIWDFEENGSVTEDMKKIFFDSIGYANITRADAKRVASDNMITEVIEKAYQTEGNTTWMRDKLKEWHEAHYRPLVDSAIATKNAAGGFIPNFTEEHYWSGGYSPSKPNSKAKDAAAEAMDKYWRNTGYRPTNDILKQGWKSVAPPASLSQRVKGRINEDFVNEYGANFGNSWEVIKDNQHGWGKSSLVSNGGGKGTLSPNASSNINDEVLAYGINEAMEQLQSGWLASSGNAPVPPINNVKIKEWMEAHASKGGIARTIPVLTNLKGHSISDLTSGAKGFSGGSGSFELTAKGIENLRTGMGFPWSSGHTGTASAPPVVKKVSPVSPGDWKKTKLKWSEYASGKFHGTKKFTGQEFFNAYKSAPAGGSTAFAGLTPPRGLTAAEVTAFEALNFKYDSRRWVPEDASGTLIHNKALWAPETSKIGIADTWQAWEDIIEDSTTFGSKASANGAPLDFPDGLAEAKHYRTGFNVSPPAMGGKLLRFIIGGGSGISGWNQFLKASPPTGGAFDLGDLNAIQLGAAGGLIPNMARGSELEGMGSYSEVYDNETYSGRELNIGYLTSGGSSGPQIFKNLLKLIKDGATQGKPFTDIQAGSVIGPRIPSVFIKAKRVLDRQRAKGENIPFMKVDGTLSPPARLIEKLAGLKSEKEDPASASYVETHQYQKGDEKELLQSLKTLGLDPKSQQLIDLQDIPMLQNFAEGFMPNYADIDDRKRAQSSYESIKTKDWTQLKESGKQVRKRILNASHFFPLKPKSAIKTMYKDVLQAGDSERPYTDIEAGEIAGPRIPSIIVRAKEMLDRVRAKGRTLPLMNIDGFFEPTWLMGTIRRQKNEYERGESEGSNYYYPGEEEDLLEALAALGANPESPADFQLANSPLLANGFAKGLIPNFQLNKSKGKIASQEEKQLERDLTDAKVANTRGGGEKHIIDNITGEMFSGSDHQKIATAHDLFVNGRLPDHYIKTHPEDGYFDMSQMGDDGLRGKQMNRMIVSSGSSSTKLSAKAKQAIKRIADAEERVVVRDDRAFNFSSMSGSGPITLYDGLGQTGEKISNFSKGLIPNFIDLYKTFRENKVMSLKASDSYFDDMKGADASLLNSLESSRSLKSKYGITSDDSRYVTKTYKIDDNNLNQMVSGVYTAGNLKKLRDRSRWFAKNVELPSEDLIAPSEWEDHGGKLGLGNNAPWDESPEYKYGTYEEWEEDTKETDNRLKAHASLMKTPRQEPLWKNHIAGTKDNPMPLARQDKAAYGSSYSIPNLGRGHPNNNGFNAEDEATLREIFSANLNKPVYERDVTEEFLDNMQFAYDLAPATKNQDKALNAARQKGLKKMQDHLAKGFMPNFIIGDDGFNHSTPRGKGFGIRRREEREKGAGVVITPRIRERSEPLDLPKLSGPTSTIYRHGGTYSKSRDQGLANEIDNAMKKLHGDPPLNSFSDENSMNEAFWSSASEISGQGKDDLMSELFGKYQIYELEQNQLYTDLMAQAGGNGMISIPSQRLKHASKDSIHNYTFGHSSQAMHSGNYFASGLIPNFASIKDGILGRMDEEAEYSQTTRAKAGPTPSRAKELFKYVVGVGKQGANWFLDRWKGFSLSEKALFLAGKFLPIPMGGDTLVEGKRALERLKDPVVREDLKKDLKSYIEGPVNTDRYSNGLIPNFAKVYHGTSLANAKSIIKDGQINQGTLDPKSDRKLLDAIFKRHGGVYWSPDPDIPGLGVPEALFSTDVDGSTPVFNGELFTEAASGLRRNRETYEPLSEEEQDDVKYWAKSYNETTARVDKPDSWRNFRMPEVRTKAAFMKNPELVRPLDLLMGAGSDKNQKPLDTQGLLKKPLGMSREEMASQFVPRGALGLIPNFNNQKKKKKQEKPTWNKVNEDLVRDLEIQAIMNKKNASTSGAEMSTKGTGFSSILKGSAQGFIHSGAPSGEGGHGIHPKDIEAFKASTFTGSIENFEYQFLDPETNKVAKLTASRLGELLNAKGTGSVAQAWEEISAIVHQNPLIDTANAILDFEVDPGDAKAGDRAQKLDSQFLGKKYRYLRTQGTWSDVRSNGGKKKNKKAKPWTKGTYNLGDIIKYEIPSNASGLIPNFVNALEEAIGREKKALTSQGSNAKIYVDKDRRLKSSQNPLGLLVANKRDEPKSGSQGVDRAIANKMDPKRHGAARGMIPSFASELTPNQQSSRSEMMDLIKWMEQVGDAAEDAAKEGDGQVRSLREQISAYKDLVNDGDSNEKQLKQLGDSLKDFFSGAREEILDFKKPTTNKLETPNLKLKDRSDEKADLNKQAEDIRGGREKLIQEFNKTAEAIEKGAKELDLPDEELAAEIEKLGMLDKKLKDAFNVDTKQAMETGALKTLDLGSDEKAEGVAAKVRGESNKALLKQSEDVRKSIDKETEKREKLANAQGKSLQRILGLQMAMSQISSFTGFDMTGLQSAVGIYEGLDAVTGLGEKLGSFGPAVQGAAMAVGLGLDLYSEFADAEKQRIKLLTKEIEERKNEIDIITKNIEKIDQFADSTAKFSEATKTGDIDAAGKFMQQIFMSAQDIGQLDPQSFEDVIKALGDTEELNKSIDVFKKGAGMGKDIKVVEQDIANVSKTLAEQFDESQFLGIDASGFTGNYIEDLDQFSDEVKTIGRTLTQNLDDDKALMLSRALDGFDTALSDPAESLFALEGILGKFDESTKATLQSNTNLSRGILDQVKIQNRYQAAVIKAKNAFKDVQKPVTVLNSRLTDLSSALNIAAESSKAAFDTLMEIGTIQGEANIESLKSTSTISERDLAAGQAAAQIKNSMEKSSQEQANALKSFANNVLGAPSDGTTALTGTMKTLAEGIQNGSISNDSAMQALVEAQKNGTEDEKESAVKTLEELRKINQAQIKDTAITNANLKAQLQKMDAQAVNAQRTTQLNDSQLKAFTNMNQGFDGIKDSSLKTMEKIAEMTGVIQTLESIGADPSILAELKESNAQLNQLSVLRGAIESTTGESFDATNLRDLGNQIDDFISSNAFGNLSSAASDTVLAISSATDTGIRALQDAGIKGSDAAEQATLIQFQPDALTSLADTMSESISSALAGSLGIDSAVVQAVNSIGKTSGITELANEIVTLSGQNEENGRQNLEAQKELSRAMIQAMQAADFAKMSTSTSSLEKAAIKLEKAAELMIENNSASGFIPNFAPSGGINASRFFNADYDAPALSRALSTESAMGAKKPVVDRHPSVGTYVRDAATQPNFAAVKRDHPEGLNQAAKNSRAIQSATAAKGFFPNFSVNSDLYYPSQFEEGLKEYERLKKEFGGGTDGAKALTKVRPTSGFRHTLWESAFYKRNVPELYNRNPMVSESFFGGKDDLFGSDESMEAWVFKFDRLLKSIDNYGSRHGLFHTQLPSNINFDGEYSGKEYRTREKGFTISKHFSGKGSVIDPTTGERSEYVDNLKHTTRLGAQVANKLDSAVINDLESVLRTYDIENYREQTSELEPESAIARRAQDAQFRTAMRNRITAWRDKYQEEASASVLQSSGDFSLIENLKWNTMDNWARVIGGKKYKDREKFLRLGNSTNIDIIKGVIDKGAMKNTEAIKALTDRNRNPTSSPYGVLTRKFDDFSAFTSIRDASIGQLDAFNKMKYSQTEWGRAISEIAQQDKFKNSWKAAMVMKGRYGEDPSASVKSFADIAQKNSDILDKVWGVGSGKEGLDFNAFPDGNENFAQAVISEPAATHGEPNTFIDPSTLYKNILTNGGYLEARFSEATGGSKNYKGPYQNWINKLPENLKWSPQLIDGYDSISPVDDRIKNTVKNAVNGLALKGEVSKDFIPDDYANQRMRDSMYDLINNAESKFLVPLSFSGDFESGIDFSKATSLMSAADMENVLAQSDRALAAIGALYGNYGEGSKGRKLEKLKNGKEYFSEINERAKKYKTGFFDRLANLPEGGKLESYLKEPFYIDTTTGDVVNQANTGEEIPSPENFGRLIPDGPISTKDGYEAFVEKMFPEELQPNVDKVESYLNNLTSLQGVYNKIHPRGALDESRDNIAFLQEQLKELNADPDAEDLEFLSREEGEKMGLNNEERKSENKKRSAQKTQRTQRRESLTEAITAEQGKADALNSKIAGVETLDSKIKQEEKTDRESHLQRERDNLYLAVLGKQSRDARRAGGTGEFDTNFEGKRNKAIEAIKATKNYLKEEGGGYIGYFNNRTPIHAEVHDKVGDILTYMDGSAPGALNQDEHDYWKLFDGDDAPPDSVESLDKFPVLKKLGFREDVDRGGLVSPRYSNVKRDSNNYSGDVWDTYRYFDGMIGENSYGENNLFGLIMQRLLEYYPMDPEWYDESDRAEWFEKVISQVQKNKDEMDKRIYSTSGVEKNQMRESHFNDHINQIRQYAKSKPFEEIIKKESEENEKLSKSFEWWENEAPKHNEQLIAYYMSPFRQLNNAAQHVEGTNEKGEFLYGKGFNAHFFQDNYDGPMQFKPVGKNPEEWPKYYKDYMDELKAQGIGSSAAEQALQGEDGRYKNDPNAMESILDQYSSEIERTGMDSLLRWATIQVDPAIGNQWMNEFEAADGGKAASAYTKGKDSRSQRHALSTERGQMLSQLGLIPNQGDFENFFGMVRDGQTSGPELIRSFAKNSDRGMQFFAHELSEAGGGDTLKEYQDYIVNRIREVGVPFADTRSIEDQFGGTIGWLEDIPGVKSSPVPVVDPARLKRFIQKINSVQKKGMVDALSKWNPSKYDYSEDTTFAEIIGAGTVGKMNESELVKNPHYLKYLLQSNQTNAFLKQLNEGDDNATEWDTFYNERNGGYSLINQDDREKSILKNRNYGLPQVSEWVSTQDSISAAKRYDGSRSLSTAVGGVINTVTHAENKNLQAALDSDAHYPFTKLYEHRSDELMGAEYLQDWISKNGDNTEALKGSNYPFGYTPGEGTASPQWSDRSKFKLLMDDIVKDATGKSLEPKDPDAGKPLPKVQSARGFVPNFSKISGEIAASKAAGYKTPVKPSQVKSMSIPGVGKTSYNTQESVFKAAGMSQPFIAPPKDSKAAKPYAKEVQSKFNFNPYGKNFANGFVPNFAPPKSLTEQNKFNGQLLSAIKTLVSLDETQIKNQETQINILNKSLESNDSGTSGNIDLMGFAEAIMNFSGNVTSSLLDFANKMHEYATSNRGDTSQADFSSLNKVSTNIKSGMDGLTEQLKNPLSIDASELNAAVSAMQDIQLSVDVPNINVNVQGVTSAADQIKQSVASEVENRVRQLLSENSFTAQIAAKINEWFGTNFS